ncbi:hypothetical protein AALO_G00175650 [Alosa alosa]|uniref:Uncharacterized protein n=1 Tax=Alosa alosa TaxID=278164 RepID=A0AAV6G7H4_9TELE|nr:hypothetical protein AALO_G00175650 [Alosa alosa]
MHSPDAVRPHREGAVIYRSRVKAGKGCPREPQVLDWRRAEMAWTSVEPLAWIPGDVRAVRHRGSSPAQDPLPTQVSLAGKESSYPARQL